MSRTSLVGSFGLARQSAKDTLATTLSYLPATSVGLNMTQNTTTLPPEVGGSYFLRGSYKTTVVGTGDVSVVVRPNTLGQYLMALCGVDNVTGVPGQTGAYQHVFTPFAPAAGVDLPWFTCVKDVSKLYAEQFLNAKLRTLRLDIPKASTLTAQTSWLATTPSAIDSPSSPTIDSTPQFQTSQATVSLTQEGSGTNISTNSIKMERYSMNFGNQLSEDEYSVGNNYLDDITLLQRSASCDMDIIVRDTALWQAVNLNGGSIPNTWSPTIYRGALTLTLNSTAVIPTTTQIYQFVINFPGLDFLMMPIGIQGADLVRATLSSQVTLGSSGADQFTLTLINGIASY